MHTFVHTNPRSCGYTTTQQQVVAGVQYRLSLVLQKSANCVDDGTPSSPDNDSGCTLDEAAGEKRFEANVWWRAVGADGADMPRQLFSVAPGLRGPTVWQ